MALLGLLPSFFLCFVLASADLSGIPTVPFTSSSGASFDISSVRSIVVDSQYGDATDQDGWTLIPPTLREFAQTFAEDLYEVAGCEVHVSHGDRCGSNEILLTIGNSSDFQDAAGRFTSEGYMIDVTNDRIKITGASPLGVWWGTRTILQQSVLNGGQITAGTGTDAPGWNTRGVMLDCGRHYYPP